MTVENIKVIVTAILKSVIVGERADKVIASIEERQNGILIYLSHGATLGEAWEVQDEIKKAGLNIPSQYRNAVIYVTDK